MKIHLRNPEGFFPETITYYKTFAELVPEEDSDIIVINDFQPIETKKVVACNSTGLDHIKAKKIISLRGEDLSDYTAVAELCLGMMIMVTRLFKKEEIRGKTLGLLGSKGRIASQFRGMAEYMGMNVRGYDKEDSNQTLKGLLKESDVVSLHITADNENKNFMDEKLFKFMQDGAIFLNSTRPWLVDEKDFLWALDNKLAAAWVDFEMPFKHKRLVTTPHAGGTTVESRRKTEMILAKKVDEYLKINQ